MININEINPTIVTMVGSRDILPIQRDLFLCLGKYFSEQNCEYRSGLAEGSDLASFVGYKHGKNYDKTKVHNYVVSKKWFHDKFAKDTVKSLDHFHQDKVEEAEALAKEARGSFAGLNDWTKLLHVRNAFQALGDDLQSPTNLTILCSEPIGKDKEYSKVKGGTNTAFRITKKFMIPHLNIFINEDFNYCFNFLKSKHALTKPTEQMIAEYEDIVSKYYPKSKNI